MHVRAYIHTHADEVSCNMCWIDTCACVCVCVCERERESESMHGRREERESDKPLLCWIHFICKLGEMGRVNPGVKTQITLGYLGFFGRLGSKAQFGN